MLIRRYESMTGNGNYGIRGTRTAHQAYVDAFLSAVETLNGEAPDDDDELDELTELPNGQTKNAFTATSGTRGKRSASPQTRLKPLLRPPELFRRSFSYFSRSSANDDFTTKNIR